MPNYDRYHEATQENRVYRAALQKSKFCNEPTVIWGFRQQPPENRNTSRNKMKLRRLAFRLLYHTRTLLRFLDAQLCGQIALGVIVVLLFQVFGIVAQIHPALVFSTVVFPVSFSINASYQRRESALNSLATQRAAARALLLMHRDWSKFDGLGKPWLSLTYQTVRAIFRDQHAYLIIGNEKFKHELLRSLYQHYDVLSAQHDRCRQAGVPPPMITVPMTRHFTMLEMMERLRVVCDYRTPSTMRTFNTVFVGLISVLMAPYFAYLGTKFGTWVAYFTACVVSFMFGCLVKVQQTLENPYENSQDNINLEAIDHWVVRTLAPISGQERDQGVASDVTAAQPDLLSTTAIKLKSAKQRLRGFKGSSMSLDSPRGSIDLRPSTDMRDSLDYNDGRYSVDEFAGFEHDGGHGYASGASQSGDRSASVTPEGVNPYDATSHSSSAIAPISGSSLAFGTPRVDKPPALNIELV